MRVGSPRPEDEAFHRLGFRRVEGRDAAISRNPRDALDQAAQLVGDAVGIGSQDHRVQGGLASFDDA